MTKERYRSTGTKTKKEVGKEDKQKVMKKDTPVEIDKGILIKEA